jgi:hypothetical protein
MMNTSLKWLVTASIVNLLGNALGTILALQQNLPADWGNSLNGQEVMQDFIGFKGTAFSAPLSFMLIQLCLTWLARRPGRPGTFAVGGLAFIGLVYTLGQAGEPILLRQFQSGGFDMLESMILLVNLTSALAMLILGIKILLTKRASGLVRA